MPPKRPVKNSAAKSKLVDARKKAESERNKTQLTPTLRVTRSATREARGIQAQPSQEHEEEQNISRLITAGEAHLRAPARQPSAGPRQAKKPIKGKQKPPFSQSGVDKATQTSEEIPRTAEQNTPVLKAAAVPPSQNLGANIDNPGCIESWARGVNPSDGFAANESVDFEPQPDVNLWFKSYGCEPPEDTMTPTYNSTAQMTSEALAPARSGRRPRNIESRSPLFYPALRERNIEDLTQTDPGRSDILGSIFQDPEKVTKLDDEEEKKWAIDFAKCLRSNESVFQRSIMMDIINRHGLADSLDWITESQWACDRMPRKMKPGATEVVKPKPDLAIAFKTRSLINKFQLTDLGDFKSLMCPEFFKGDKEDRAFHFFSIESKDPKVASFEVAIYQNLNTASQALHNIYQFMAKAGNLDKFYEKVRFFSVVATFAGFHLRVHRAVSISEGRIRPDYPLGFYFDEICNLTGQYSKEKVVRIVQNVLVNYGIKILMPILQETVGLVYEKLKKERQESPSSGQKRPADHSLESAGGQKARIGDLNPKGGTGSLSGQLVGSQNTEGVDGLANMPPELRS